MHCLPLAHSPSRIYFDPPWLLDVWAADTQMRGPYTLLQWTSLTSKLEKAPPEALDWPYSSPKSVGKFQAVRQAGRFLDAARISEEIWLQTRRIPNVTVDLSERLQSR